MAPTKKKLNYDKPKQDLSVYVERYREIELYLNLLTRPLLSQLFPATPVGTSSIFEKVESEIKAFFEQKLQNLTGMAQDGSSLNLDPSELKALKLVASKIMNKPEPEPEVEPVQEAVVAPEHIEWNGPALRSPPTTEVQVKTITQEPKKIAVPELPEDEVKLVDVNAKRKRRQKTTKELIDETVLSTEVPDVKMGTSDRMDKVRPAGVKPLPSTTPQQAMYLASMQAQATAQAATDMGMGLGAPQAQQMSNAPIQLSDDFSMFR